MKLDLNGKWQFKSSRDADFMDAVVPGTNFLDLIRLDRMKNPLVDVSPENTRDNEWFFRAGTDDWIYRKTFNVSEDFLKADNVFLVLNKIDTLAFVVLNDQEVDHSENAFLPFRRDVKSLLKPGENVLEVRICGPVAFVVGATKLIKTPKNLNGLTGDVHIRKPAFHFGWDFAPFAPASGIREDVYLETACGAEISDFRISQKHNSDGAVTLSMTARVERYNTTDDFSTFFSVLSPDKSEFNAKGIEIENGLFKADIEIKNPKLWWTRDLSDKPEQPLYEVVVSLSRGDEIVDGKIVKIGLRDLVFDNSPDEIGKNFRFTLNGVPLFIKGANYVPPDVTDVFDREKCRRLLSDVEFMNMNMIRIFGGSGYENEFFYDECDKRGILVWQDFPFACQGYPLFLPAFMENVKKEAEYQVKRLHFHPSLALFCGNNEIEAMSVNWMFFSRYIDVAEPFFYYDLKKIVQENSDVAYIPGSPSGVSYMFGYAADNVGDAHIWAVWHGMKPATYFKKRLPRFASEFGMMSLPSENSMKKILGDDENINSKKLKARDFSQAGVGKIKYYTLERFNAPKDISGWVYASQIAQAEGLREGVSHFRRNKPTVNGTLVWQLNDVFEGLSWSVRDFDESIKAAGYYLRRYYAPVAVNIDAVDGGFYVHTFNDTNKDISAKLTFKVCNYDGEVLVEKHSDITLAAGESKMQLAQGMAIVRNQNKRLRCFAYAELETEDGKYTDTRLVRREKYARLLHPVIKREYDFIRDGVLKITLSTDVFARGVFIKNNINGAKFSDNFFDLVPGETKEITVNLGRTCPINGLDESLPITSADVIEIKGNSAAAFFTRLFVSLHPVNFFNSIYYRKIPRNVKKRIVAFFDEQEKEKEE